MYQSQNFRLLSLWRTGLRAFGSAQVLLGSAVLALEWLLVFCPGGKDPLGLLKSSDLIRTSAPGPKTFLWTLLVVFWSNFVSKLQIKVILRMLLM